MIEKREKIIEKKAIYNLNELNPDRKEIINLYPEILNCQGCNTCTLSCPQDINVMDYISNALIGNIAEVAEKSFNCIMCGLCADKCPAKITPYNIGLLCRRLFGRYLLPKANHLGRRISEIKEGHFDIKIKELKKMEKTELSRLYNERDIEA